MSETRKKIAVVLLAIYAASTFISMATMSIGFGILLIATCVLSSRAEWALHLKRPLVKTYLILTVLMTAIILVSITRQKLAPFEVFGALPEVRYRSENAKLVYLLNPVFLSFLLLQLGVENLKKFISAHWMTLFGIAIFGLQQFFTGRPESTPTPPMIPGVETYLTTLDLGLTHSVTSNLTIAVFPLLAAVLIRPEAFRDFFKRPLFRSRALWATICGLAAFIVYMTFARSAWITFPLGVGALLFLGLSPQKIKIALVGLILGVVVLSQLPVVKTRMSSKGGYSDRIALWQGNIELFRAHPLFGVGWRQSSKLVDGAVRFHYQERLQEPIPDGYFKSHAHNNWLEMLSSTGFFGILSFFLWNLFVLRKAWMQRNDLDWGWWIKGFLAGMFVIHLNGLIQVNFWDSKVFHQIMLQVGVLLTILLITQPAHETLDRKDHSISY